MKIIRILILEDDLETLSLLLKKLDLLEEKLANSASPKDFSLITISEFTQVQEIVNKSQNLEFDVILLDRDCKAGGSFMSSILRDSERIKLSQFPQFRITTK